MTQPPKKLRKHYKNDEHPVIVLRFEDTHEIQVKKGTAKEFDCYAGETIKILAIHDPAQPKERDLLENRKADDFPSV